LTSRSVILSILVMLGLAVLVKLTAPRTGPAADVSGPDIGPLPASGVILRSGAAPERSLAPSNLPGLDAVWTWAEGDQRRPVPAAEVARAWDDLRAGILAGRASADAFTPAITLAPAGAGVASGGAELAEAFAGRVLARASGKVWSISPGSAGAWLNSSGGGPGWGDASSVVPLMVVPSTVFDRARLESPARSIGLALVEGQWTLDTPISARADEAYCVEMLRRIASIPAEREVRGGEIPAGATDKPALRLVLGSALPDGSRLEQSLEITAAADRQGQEYFAMLRAERVASDGSRGAAWSPRAVTIARARIERLSAEPADYLPGVPVRALAGDVRSVRWGEAEFSRAGSNWNGAEGVAAPIDRAEALTQLVELATRVAAGTKAVGGDVPTEAQPITLRDATGATIGEFRVWTGGGDEAPTVTIASGPARWTWPADRARTLARALGAR
jgi:hypothetical protein